MYIVILAGGSGTRFWPLSRRKTPKQLISVFGGKSMLQRTVERVLPLKPKRILVLTNLLQVEETSRQLVSYQKGCSIDVIAEPLARNTAPAIGLAATIISRHDPDGLMVVLPADHFISDEDKFRQTVKKGQVPALNGYLVTLGIMPTRPETGYGYIEAEKELRGNGPYPVRRFVEKPELAKAFEFLHAGNFFWNSGMFIWRADVILKKISEYMPELAISLDSLVLSKDIWEHEDLNPQIKRIYQGLSGESIDFGVMEKSDEVMVIPAEFGWSDVGSWSAIPEVMAADDVGNLSINTRENIIVNSSGCLVYGGGKLTALVGVKDLIVVDTPDALLVCGMDRAQDVKKIVEKLEKMNLSEYL